MGPKRAPKVVYGEGEQHLEPEMGNNISWPEMGSIEWGEIHLRRKPMSTPRATVEALRRVQKCIRFYGPISGPRNSYVYVLQQHEFAIVG